MRTATRRDSTDEDPTWCTIKLWRVKDKPLRKDQCEHADARGRYVVEINGAWQGFEPATKLQTNIWVNGREERERRLKWLCYECSEIMPLGDQL